MSMLQIPQFRDITFLWPLMLWLLALLPVLVYFYVRMVRRQSQASVNLAAMTLMLDGQAQPAKTRIGAGRHTTAWLLLLALTLMILAVARPQALVVLPTRMDAIILAMDISGSMRATDVKPDRLTAAQTAAKTFINDQPRQVKIGLVSIAATAALAQSPTDKREDIIAAIDNVKLQNGSALGSGVIVALATMLPESGIDVDKVVFGRQPLARDFARQREIDRFKPVPPGSNNSAAIVLISDGESNTGPELLAAAKFAAERGVRVYTVGIGTKTGATLTVDGWSMRVRLDEETLKKTADLTQGEYFRAANAADLKKIYAQLSARMSTGRGRTTEITSLLMGLGALFAMVAVLDSMLRFNRVF